MKDPSLSTLIQIGVDVLNVTRDQNTGTPLAQIGDVVGQQVDSDRAVWYQHVGFVSTPTLPVAGQQAAQGVVVKRGADDAVIASRDLRGQALQGNMGAGEACVYAGGAAGNGQARVILRGDGTIAAITTDTNTAAGNTVYWRVTPKEERFHAPWGKRWLDASGYHVRHVGGAAFDLGAAGLPAPFSAFSSYALLQADMVRIDAAMLSLGRDTGNMQPVVLGTSLVAFLTQLVGIVAAINATTTGLPAAALLPQLQSLLGKTQVA